jgi:hypothetical protein
MPSLLIIIKTRSAWLGLKKNWRLILAAAWRDLAARFDPASPSVGAGDDGDRGQVQPGNIDVD